MFQRRKNYLKPLSVVTQIPAPIGGWNARDALANMDPLDAVSLENWFPSTSDVMLRHGHTRHVTGISGQVETLMAYAGGAVNKLFGIASGTVYDVTTAGAVGAPVLSSLTNAQWQYVNVSTSGGNYLYMVNGLDLPYTYDGTTWANPAITGVDESTFININLFKNRVWFIQKETLKAWYLPTASIAGVANVLDLSAFADLGGYLVAMATWTIDAGYGVDDLAAFITNKGQVLVYRGTDPSSATTWALVGIWQIGAPVGYRCFIKYSGDLLLICQDGVLPMSAALQSSRVNPRTAISDKIQNAMSEAVSIYGANFGWQLLYFPKQNMLFLNVPVQTGDLQEQYVMNCITKAWCKFTGWKANCWEIFEDEPYFGGDGFVGKAWDGLSDNEIPITANGLQAFNDFSSPGVQKRFTLMRPTLQTNGVPEILASLNVDYSLADPTSPLSFTPIAYGVWDISLWDVGLWGSSLVVANAWQGITGVGYCGAPRLKASVSGLLLQWVSTDIVSERGAIL